MNKPWSERDKNGAANIQTILGAGGVIGCELMRELASFATRIRLVRRHPQSPGPAMESMAADLLNPRQAADAVKGSAVAYLVAGLPYRAAVWESDWPVIMRNVIDGCKRHQVRLVFLDNVYLYGYVDGPMTEETPINPCSRKGQVRARMAAMLMDEILAGNLCGLIARAADFYGPGATNTFVHPMVFELLRDGKKAAWLCNDAVPHAMLFTPDAGKALAVLGNTDDAYGQVWHLPTGPHAWTGRDFIHAVADAFGVKPAYRVLSPTMLRLTGLLRSSVRETTELLYQHQRPYLVDSRKFTMRFFGATAYADGIHSTVLCMHGQ